MPSTSGCAVILCASCRTSCASGAAPSSGSMVSRAICTPDQRINSATASPIQPSGMRLVKCPTRHEASTAAVASTSLRLSAAVACSADEPMMRPSSRLNSASKSLTAMDASRTMTMAAENSTASGCRIFCTDDLTSSAPMSRISAATTSPLMYSMRSCP